MLELTPLLAGLVEIPVVAVTASIPDLLRLVAIPVFGWAAVRDIKTRRVPTRAWYPIAVLALVLLVWDGYNAVLTNNRFFFVQVAISVGFIVPLVTAFWYMGSFGGADTKAFYVLALLFPAYPVYLLPGLALPMEPSPAGVFSLTILSNTVVAGALYPVGVAVSNLLRGRIALPMVIGRPITTEELTEEYGMLVETPDGFTRRGLDLDALRMYLRWRQCTLAELRTDPDRLRDPDSLPAEPGEISDGNIVTDGGTETPPPEAADPDGPAEPDFDDPWGAQAFLDDIETSAYGTSPDGLREALEVLVTADEVWVSPGIPFIVPTLFGLLVSFVYGDVLVSLLGMVGLG